MVENVSSKGTRSRKSANVMSQKSEGQKVSRFTAHWWLHIDFTSYHDYILVCSYDGSKKSKKGAVIGEKMRPHGRHYAAVVVALLEEISQLFVVFEG
jgi:hypothetical protein